MTKEVSNENNVEDMLELCQKVRTKLIDLDLIDAHRLACRLTDGIYFLLEETDDD